jgi:hypothetical protein
VADRLIKDGFKVLIYNFNADNPSHMTYIIWDFPAFEKWLEEQEKMTIENFREGLL